MIQEYDLTTSGLQNDLKAFIRTENKLAGAVHDTAGSLKQAQNNIVKLVNGINKSIRDGTIGVAASYESLIDDAIDNVEKVYTNTSSTQSKISGSVGTLTTSLAKKANTIGSTKSSTGASATTTTKPSSTHVTNYDTKPAIPSNSGTKLSTRTNATAAAKSNSLHMTNKDTKQTTSSSPASRTARTASITPSHETPVQAVG